MSKYTKEQMGYCGIPTIKELLTAFVLIISGIVLISFAVVILVVTFF